MKKEFLVFAGAVILAALLIPVTSMGAISSGMPAIRGIRLEFILFALTLAGVAIFHRHTMFIALGGLTVILISKYLFVQDFNILEHLAGSSGQEGEWKILLNLAGLLLGFAILARYFEESGIPGWLPSILPSGWTGGLILLFLIMVLSSFLDNIAAAIIGGTIALVVYKGKVHIGFIAAIIAASNAGGAGSVVGDTTTTLMWIDGVNPLDVTHAYIASIAAFGVFGVIGSIQQEKYQAIAIDRLDNHNIDHVKLGVVVLILILAIVSNWAIGFPAAGVWLAILIGGLFRKTPWQAIPKSIQGSVFLLALVTCASLMPVEDLPPASWQSSFLLGFVSSVFDNIPLTKLCLEQGGYDWGILAYAVGFGGSMIWFGSSAGVAISNLYPEARSVWKYLRGGWHITIAYILGFMIMLWIVGWNPHAPH